MAKGNRMILYCHTIQVLVSHVFLPTLAASQNKVLSLAQSCEAAKKGFPVSLLDTVHLVTGNFLVTSYHLQPACYLPAHWHTCPPGRPATPSQALELSQQCCIEIDLH